MIMRPGRILIIAMLPVWLAACGQNVRPSEPAHVPEPVAEPDLPDVELTGDLLYDILLGEIAGRQGNFQVSILALTRAAQNSRDPRLAERATKASIYAKEYGLGLKAGRLWVELRPKDADARQSLAALYLYRNEPAAAQMHLEQLIGLAADHGHLGRSYMEIAGMMGRQRNREAAMEVMQSLTALHPNNPEGQFALAHLSLRSGQLEEARAAVDRALKLKPGWDDAAMLKARVLISAKADKGVEQFYQGYLRRYTKSHMMRLGYARYLVDLKRWEQARKQFLRVVKNRPNDHETVYALALLSLQTGHIDDADRHFRHVLRLNSNNYQARLYLGQVAEKRKHYDDAIGWYSSITTGDQRFEAQIRIGIVMARQGKLDEARQHLHQTRPDNLEESVQRTLAEEQILREAKQYHDALEVLNAALVKLPQNKDLLYARALVADKLDMMELQEEDLRKILRSDPRNAHALNALGYSLADRTTRYREALILIRQALEVRPDDPFILDSMGWVQYRMGNMKAAISYLRRALSLRKDPEISAHLGEVLWVSGERREAEGIWRRALQDTPDSEPLLDIIKKFTK